MTGPPKRTPAAIRDALIDVERAEFERAYADALNEAGQATQRDGVVAHRRMLAKAELIARTGHNPDAGSYDELMARLKERIQHEGRHEG